MSLPPTATGTKLSSSPSNQASILLNRSVNSSINNKQINNNRGNPNSNSNSNEDISRAGTSPVSLPTLGAVVSEKRSSVRELAASLARQSQNQNQAEEQKKKADSLPRNVPVPSNNSTVENQGLHADAFFVFCQE